MKALFLALALLSALSASAADAAAPADPFMNLYEGFWATRDGKMGRVSAQIRPVGGGKYDGFVALDRSGSLVGALKLGAASATDGKMSFTGTGESVGAGDLAPQLDGHCQITKGRLTGAFKGDLGEGTFEASGSTKESPTMGAKPPGMGVMIFSGTASDKFEDFQMEADARGEHGCAGGRYGGEG
jgi:hypothetical protein